MVSGGASALPEVFRSVVVALGKGDYKAATAAHETILKVKDIVRAAPIPSYYEILRVRGFECGRPRAPFLTLEKEVASRMVGALRGLGLV